jgi:hypothetical protein
MPVAILRVGNDITISFSTQIHNYAGFLESRNGIKICRYSEAHVDDT